MSEDRPPPSRRRLSRPRAGFWSHAVVAVLGLYLGGLLVANLGNLPFGSALASIYPRFGGLDETSLQVAWQDIENNYVLRGVPGSVGTEASEAALVQAVDSTYDDRFSAYFTKSQYQQFTAAVNQDRSGSIGISIEETCAGATLCASGQNPTQLAVEDVLHGQPAERAGVRNGDVLVAVGATQVSSLGTGLDEQLAKLSNLIDGAAGGTGNRPSLRNENSRTGRKEPIAAADDAIALTSIRQHAKYPSASRSSRPRNYV